MTRPALVYIAKIRNGAPELRYSLRSVAANLPHASVWIVGPTRPDWATDDVRHLPTEEPRQEKWQNIVAAMRAICAIDELPRECVYMNDDFFVIEPVQRMPVLYRGVLGEVTKARNKYGRGFVTTETVLRDLGMKVELRDYEMHAPLPFDPVRMGAVLREAGDVDHGCLHYRSLYGNFWMIGGDQSDDVKVHASTERVPSHAGPFVSTSSASWGGRVGKMIRERFPDPCRYEIGA